MKKKLKAAVIGFGRLGHLHSCCYDDMKDVELVAVCDTNAKALVARHPKTGCDLKKFDKVKHYKSFEELVKGEPDLDILDICLPTSLHAEYAIKGMKAGYNVITEKPMALTTKECDKMIAASKKTGKLLMVAQCLRFNPQYAYIADIIKSGKYGKLLQMEMHRNNTMQNDWFLDVKKSGGAAMDLHIHDVDFIQHALGMPNYLYAIGVPAGSGGIDDCLAIYYYDDGLKVIAQGSWTRNKFSSSMSAVFEKWNLELDGEELTRNKMHKIQKVKTGSGNMYSQEIAYFAQCVRKGVLPEVASMESTRNTVYLIEKEMESIRTGLPVSL